MPNPTVIFFFFSCPSDPAWLIFFPSLPLSQRPHHAHALFDFTPHHPSQLRFLRGDVIELMDCSDSLRWRGRCHGHVGFFPPEYVQPIYHCQWPACSPRSISERPRPWPRPPHCSPALHLTGSRKTDKHSTDCVFDSSYFSCEATCQSQTLLYQLPQAK